MSEIDWFRQPSSEIVLYLHVTAPRMSRLCSNMLGLISALFVPFSWLALLTRHAWQPIFLERGPLFLRA